MLGQAALAEALAPDRYDELQGLIELFSRFATISGVTGKERPVALEVKQYVKSYPLQVFEDEAGTSFGGSQGNLILVPDQHNPDAPALAFLAHLDTVRDTGKTHVLVKEGRITSAGNTQLGADNRWGLTLLLRLIDLYFELPEEARPNIIFVCTVGEEAGMLGAKQLDLKPWNVEMAMVLDSALRPGAYIESCAGMSLFEAEFTGRAAHSAVRPSDGLNAIAMAAEALSVIFMQPLPKGVTANVGGISGGDLTVSNVIPAGCRFNGEVRAVKGNLLKAVLESWEAICRSVAEKSGGSLYFEVTPDFAPYQHEADSPHVCFVRNALAQAGLEAVGVTYSGGSDANALAEAGIPAVNLGIGAQKPHADEEFVLLEDMLAGMDMIRALLAQASQRFKAQSPSSETQHIHE
ncbi:tripeptide aminopeptidase [Cyclonatronum proteinivorum]|uniref:Tripeptide aminopeptidase n=2 Tax=Cyclonatronum proteinivorum TaxID=1457365 RepID=A0A345ULP2_9BACT|nr:tripeptide aminopeptidase [Cyclonatronum proteinivorum]